MVLLPPNYPHLSPVATDLLIRLVAAAGPAGTGRYFQCVHLDQPGWHITAQELKGFNQEVDTYDVREYLKEMDTGGYIKLQRYPQAWGFTLNQRAIDWRGELRPLF